ncbi:MAG: hypothetical protein Q7K57_32660 [Burkholderiaceae bacterium]|nr:hypothetical protein [Burkholderiaceae bacterium]
MLNQLRPHAQTSVDQIAGLEATFDWTALLPSHLNDGLLISIARDCRSIQEAESKYPLTPESNGAIYIACRFLMLSNGVESIKEAASLPPSIMSQMIKMLQECVEREIIARIVGIRAAPINILESFDELLPIYNNGYPRRSTSC